MALPFFVRKYRTVGVLLGDRNWVMIHMMQNIIIVCRLLNRTPLKPLANANVGGGENKKSVKYGIRLIGCLFCKRGGSWHYQHF